ncbi:MAG: multiubiquitin domain-containing protein [Caulobacter sp.]|nr:multiubiquitin domain-containing protein [Caulobacter sp.]
MTQETTLASAQAGHRAFEVAINDATHAFRDPVVTGEQILQAARQFPTDQHLVFQLLADGQLEELRLDETVDLREPGREKFITFKSDRSFRFTLDGRRFEWGLPFITGLQLKRLAGVDPNTYGVWLAQRVGDDRLIGNTEQVDLTAEGVERFFTGIDTTTEGSGPVLPPEDREYLEGQGIAFEERVEGGARAVILKAHSLPSGRFDTGAADILVLLPAGYPDCAPDMFYLIPWVRLAGSGRYPRAADQPHVFAGQRWQRWSRHNTAWRPGVDGIWTMLRRIERALEIAA